MEPTDGKVDTTVRSTGFSTFGSDKPGSAWWVWTGNAVPEAWATSARPFWTRALAAVGRTVGPNDELKITQDDLKLLAAALTAKGVTPKFDPNGIMDVNPLRAFVWLGPHEGKGSLEDVIFPLANGKEVALPPALGFAITDKATDAPRAWQLGMQGQDALIRKAVGLPQLDPSLQNPPQQGGEPQEKPSMLPLVLGIGAAVFVVYLVTRKPAPKPATKAAKELGDGTR